METTQFMPFDVNAALRRGSQLLKDRDFSKAQAVYDQILMSSPENPDAFVGQLLCENKCASLGELTQVWPGLFREEKTATLDDALSDEERAAFPGLDGFYPSRVASAAENREQMERYMDRDNNLKHALEYGGDELRAGLARIRSAVLAAYDSRVEAAERDEEKARTEVRERLNALKEERLRAAEAQKPSANVLPNPAKYPRQTHAPAAPTPAEQPAVPTPAEQPAEPKKTDKVRKVLKLTLILSLAAIVLVGAFLLISHLMGKNAVSKDYADAEQLLKDGRKAEAAIAFGKLGDYRDARERSFALWSELRKPKTLAAGFDFTVGLDSNGIMIHAGNVPAYCHTKLISIDAGQEHVVGLLPDGDVWAEGNNENGQCSVIGWKNRVEVAAGAFHTVALHSGGTVAATGSNNYGQCNVDKWTDIVAVSAGRYHTVGLRNDGTVVAVGRNDTGSCNVSGWTDIVAISAGMNFTVGLRADGTVVATGENFDGQCDVSTLRNVTAVSAGDCHTVVLCADGSVLAVGANDNNQCGVSGWKDVIAICTGYYHTAALCADGTVVAVGWNAYGQCDVSGWTDIKRP